MYDALEIVANTVFVTAICVEVEAQDANDATEKAEPHTGLCYQCARTLDVGEVDFDRPSVVDENGKTLIDDGKPTDA